MDEPDHAGRSARFCCHFPRRAAAKTFRCSSPRPHISLCTSLVSKMAAAPGKNQHLDQSHVIYQSNKTPDYGSFFVLSSVFSLRCGGRATILMKSGKKSRGQILHSILNSSADKLELIWTIMKSTISRLHELHNAAATTYHHGWSKQRLRHVAVPIEFIILRLVCIYCMHAAE